MDGAPPELPTKEGGRPRHAPLLALVLLLPLGSVLFSTTRDAWVSPDGYAYVVGGYHLASGDGYVSDIPRRTPATPIRAWPPLYSALIAAGIRLGVPPLSAAMWIVGCAWLLLVAGTYALGRALGAPRAGLAAALYVATSAEVFSWAHWPLSDLPFAALAIALLAVLAWYRRERRRDLAVAAALGVLAALAVALRYVGVLLAIPVLIFFWRAAPVGRRLRLTALAAAPPVLVVAAWTVRNARLGGAIAGADRIADLPWDATVAGASSGPLRSLAQALLPGVRLIFPAFGDYPTSAPAVAASAAAWIVLLAAFGLGLYRTRRRAAIQDAWAPIELSAGLYVLALVVLKLTGSFIDPIHGRFLLWLPPLLALALFALFPVESRGQRAAFWGVVGLLVLPNLALQLPIGSWYAHRGRGPYDNRSALLYSLAYDAQARRDFRRCVAYLEDLHRGGRQYRQSRFISGWCRQSLGDLPHAVADYGLALADDPRHVGSLMNLGWAWLSLGEPERAARSFDRALAIDPHNGNARAGLEAAQRARARGP